MTKVVLDPSLLEYREDMAALVCKIIRERNINGVSPRNPEEPLQTQSGFLCPPIIEAMVVDIWKEQEEGLIQINTFDDFGIINVHVTIRTAEGDFVDSGDAIEEPEGSGFWAYIATISVPSGTSVIVYATATDCLGGVGALSADKTMP